MQMTDKEIVFNYKRSNKGRNQVIVLSELNACDPEVIERILIKAGIPEAEIKPVPKKKNVHKPVAPAPKTKAIKSTLGKVGRPKKAEEPPKPVEKNHTTQLWTPRQRVRWLQKNIFLLRMMKRTTWQLQVVKAIWTLRS